MVKQPFRLAGNILDAQPEALPILGADAFFRFVTNAVDSGAHGVQ